VLQKVVLVIYRCIWSILVQVADTYAYCYGNCFEPQRLSVLLDTQFKVNGKDVTS
jgi:hypothetical protein